MQEGLKSLLRTHDLIEFPKPNPFVTNITEIKDDCHIFAQLQITRRVKKIIDIKVITSHRLSHL